MEPYITGTRQHIVVHNKVNCLPPCPIHNPSNHHMKDWPTHWRDDRKLMERVCEHGITHPDPDDLANKALYMTPEQLRYEESHGCDGCCTDYPIPEE